MVWSENAGKISRCQMRENFFWWELPNYFAYELDPEETDQALPFIISSPSFSSFDNKWRFALIQNGETGQAKSLGLFLWKISTFKLSPCLVRLSLTNSYGSFHRSIEGETDLTGCFGSWDFSSIKTLYQLKKALSPAGILRFSCEISKKLAIIDDIPQMSISDGKNNEDDLCCEDKTTTEDEITTIGDELSIEKKKVLSMDKGIKSLIDDLKQVLLEGKMFDAVLKIDSREFKVHKVILVARSPVFASMFEHDMAEKKDSVVDIPDCTAESFEIFLHYLYSGSVETLSASTVYNVYYAADKYHVEDLKEKCVKFMIKDISVETFCDVITLALHHGEPELKIIAIDFFCQNIKKIIKTVQWQKYMDENSTQANELLIKALDA